MATEKKTVTPIDIDALVEKRLNVNKDELRQQILEEQLSEILQSDALQEATLSEAIEQLKDAGKEIWKFVSAKSIADIARQLSGVDRLEKKLKRTQKTRRARITQSELDEHKKKPLDLLTSSKEAQTVGQITKSLQADSQLLKRVLAELRNANLIVIQGEKRATRYSIA
jgi:glutaredoxin 2